jgi:hypothetical protein
MNDSPRQPDPATWHGNIPFSILFDPNATQNVKLVYAVLNAKAGASRWWNATHESIALACGWKASSRKTVTAALAYLEGINAIRATKRINPANGHHAATRYDVLDWHLIVTDWTPMGSSTTLETEEADDSGAQCGSPTPPMWSGDTSNVVEEPQLTNVPTNVPTNKFTSGCACATHDIIHGNILTRKGTPPSLQGLKTKDAQKTAINKYVGSPPLCFSQEERRRWYNYEKDWQYPSGASTRTKAEHDVAWAWGVSVEDVVAIPGCDYLVDQAQKAHSGLTVDGFAEMVDAQSSTALRWSLARLLADDKDTEEWGFEDWDLYVEDPTYRSAVWPEVRRPGMAA